MKPAPGEPTHEHDPIFAAIKALDDRKNAAGLGGELADESQARVAYLGLGLDFSELETARHMVAETVAEALGDIEPNPTMLLSLIVALWMDGLVTGILLEEHRR